MNYGMIFYVLGMILNFEALFMLPSLVVALIYGEWAGVVCDEYFRSASVSDFWLYSAYGRCGV